MTHDDIINHVGALLRPVTPRYHLGDQSLIRPAIVTIAYTLKATAERVAVTEAHPAWRIYQEFTKAMTSAEIDDHAIKYKKHPY